MIKLFIVLSLTKISNFKLLKRFSILTLLFSHCVFAVEQQTEATCILLKQQVAMYSNNKLNKNKLKAILKMKRQS